MFFGCSDGMEREACVCDHGFERSDLCAEIIIIIIIIYVFLKNELFCKVSEDVNSRSVRPSASYTYILGMLKRKGLPMGTVGYLGRDHRLTLPTPLQQKLRFSNDKNRFLVTVLTIWTFSLNRCSNF